MTQDIFHIGLDDVRQGIVHIVGPEQGFTLPGLVLVCADSHTSTHGAFGALAFGVGTSELEQVLATQVLPQRRSRSMRVTLRGALGSGVSAKDVALAVIGAIGADAGTGFAIEFAGDAVSRDVHGRSDDAVQHGGRGRLTLRSRSRRTSLTYEWLEDRPMAPVGGLWDEAISYWRTLPSDPGAAFDVDRALDVAALEPQVTWGTSPEHVVGIGGLVPDPAAAPDETKAASWSRALDYMGLKPGTAMREIAVDRVFIGSCTNSRLSDLRAAAEVVSGRRLAPGVHGMVTPGSGLVRQAAEREGLARLFEDAGFEWRLPGCSMCFGSAYDSVGEGHRCASTSNRNFENRQGLGARTHLMSPAMAAAAGVTGRLTDVRELS